MADLRGIALFLFAWLAKAIIFFPALCQGIKISAEKKNIGDYGYELASGTDIYGNKLIAPHANKYWVKPGGRPYGLNEHISVTMAINKHNQHNTQYADRWERVINFLDKNHLQKTLNKLNSVI